MKKVCDQLASARKAKSDSEPRKVSPLSSPTKAVLPVGTDVVSLEKPPLLCDDVDREMECATSPRSMMLALQDQVEQFHPELLPLLKHNLLPEQHQHKWHLDSIVDAVKLSSFLQDRLLCLPELNRNSPCYSARSIVLLFTKIKYLETFPPDEIAAYAESGEHAYEEVRLLHQLKNVSSNAVLYSRLAELLHIPTHGDAWNETIRFVACALPFAEQTETLLIRGSDERSVLCATTKTNKYNGSTIPCRNDISRASCTCSSITLDGFTRCDKLRQDLLLNSFSINPNSRTSTDYFDAKMARVRDRVAACLGVAGLVQDDSVRVLLTPSGTDAELLATSAALARLFSSAELAGGGIRKVTSIISAQGEIGRGSSSASGGRHFSELTPGGEAATPGDVLRRYPTNLVDVVELPGRTDDGAINHIEAEVCETVMRLLDDATASNVVLLHVVMGSKTGYVCPSLDVVDRLAIAYPNRLLVVIDACQMRVESHVFHEFASKGYITLVTGSKFFGGAPFCGAVLLPMRCVYEMEATAVEEYAELCLPLGFEDYFSRYDLPESMKHVRSRMGAFMNVGLLLRWESALATMEPYFDIDPLTITEITRAYISQCKHHLRTNWRPMVEILYDPIVEASTASTRRYAKPMETIISFKVWDDRTQTHLSAMQLRDLHMLLSKDLSRVLPPSDSDVVSKRCLLGQPVQLGKLPGGVLRIAMGADMVNTIHYQSQQGIRTLSQIISDLIQEDDVVLQKIRLILQHWELLRQQYIDAKVVAMPIELPKPLSDWDFSVKQTEIARVVQHMCRDGILCSTPPTRRASLSLLDEAPPENKLAVVYDLDAIDMAFQSLLTSFPSHFEHRFAVQSCPLSFFLKRAIENDVGVACASIIEVQHALRLGCAPHKIVFDSPCKTRRDIAIAINAGVEVNADNFDELEIIRAHAEELLQSNFPECTPRFAGDLPRIGLRVNPLVLGTNDCRSVHSKFGVPLTPANRHKIIAFFRENPWMTGLHCHVGSQDGSLERLAHGAATLCNLANDIDAAAGMSRVRVLNIGGGLPSNYDSDTVAPTFAEYVDVLHTIAPQLFERCGRTILTEFGRAVSAKTGWTISEVEYVKRHDVHDVLTGPTGRSDILRQTAIIHAGSDLFLRSCYQPDLFPHRLSVFNSLGMASETPLCVQNVAGPMCFGGDVLGHGVALPTIVTGDFVVVHDAGANTLSMFSRHCSRPAPAVYGYRVQDDELTMELLKPAESPEDIMRFWG